MEMFFFYDGYDVRRLQKNYIFKNWVPNITLEEEYYPIDLHANYLKNMLDKSGYDKLQIY